MAQVIERKSVGPSGLADVRILKTGARVTFMDGHVYDVQNYPEGLKAGKYAITLTADLSRIMGVRPPAGQYILDFLQFGNRVVGRVQGQPDTGLPTNKVQKGGPRKTRDGRAWIAEDQLIATVEFVVAQGTYEGLKVVTNIPYVFVSPMSGEFTAYSGKRRELETVENFLHCVTGMPINNIDIPWSDDPSQLLMRFEAFIQEHSKPFIGQVDDKGFANIQSFSELPAELMPKRAVSKKAPAKAKKGKK